VRTDSEASGDLPCTQALLSQHLRHQPATLSVSNTMRCLAVV